MSRKMTKYTTEFKTKLVLEVLKNERTLNEIATEYNIIPKNLQNWKSIFLANAEIAMEPAKAVKEYKDKIIELETLNNNYAKVVGKMTVELEWMEGKLESLDLFDKKEFIESELTTISVKRQCPFTLMFCSKIMLKNIFDNIITNTTTIIFYSYYQSIVYLM